MSNPLIEVVSLKKEFVLGPKHRVLAVDNVDLTIDEGEVLSIVGESGCGKTTLGRCLVRLIEPTSGSIKFRGEDILSYRWEKLRQFRQFAQIIFQDPLASLDPRWRVYDILDEPLRVHSIVPRAERKHAIKQLLNDVGLAEEAGQRFPHELSGGQRQRIGIARAISLNPMFLVADEPVSALDVSVRAQVLNLLLKLRRDRGISILFIGHDLGVIRQVASRVAVMYLGIVVETSPIDELFQNPRHPYTRALLSAIPSVSNRGRGSKPPDSVSGDVPSTVGVQTGCRFRGRCHFAQELCAVKPPALKSVGALGHLSACHFSEELPKFLSPSVSQDAKSHFEAAI